MSPDKRRVGIVAKARLERAAEHLAQIAAWLEARGVQPVFDPETAAQMTRWAQKNGMRVMDSDLHVVETGGWGMKFPILLGHEGGEEIGQGILTALRSGRA